jgi:hypothetical protein
MDQPPALMMGINVCCGQGFTTVLNMTQRLFQELLLRLGPTFRHPEGSAQVTSVGFPTFRDFMNPRVCRERVGIRL